MEIVFDKSFEKSIEKLRNDQVKPKLKLLILSLEKAESLALVKNIKKLKGFDTYFRAKIGDYRVGLELDGQCCKVYRCCSPQRHL